MTTYADIVTESLDELGYQAAETPVEATDMKKGFKKLNDMLSEWLESGLIVAAPGENSSDTIRIQRGAVNGVVMNLAGRLSAPFRKPLTNELVASIKAANQNMLRIIVKPIDVDYPDTLPMGSGNRCSDDDDDIFYPSNQKPNF